MTQFSLNWLGRGRRAAVSEAGTVLCECRYLGPEAAALDFVVKSGLVAARVRGGTMPEPDFHVTLADGESLRVTGSAPSLTVLLPGGGRRRITVEDTAPGRRTLHWDDGPTAPARLHVVRGDPDEPWRLEVAGHLDPLRMLALLHAGERLLREADLR